MNPTVPFLLIRARVKPEARALFDDWYRQVHLPDVARIPGIVQVEAGKTAAGTWLGFYTFETTAAVPAALNSAEAAYARGTWERWGKDMEDMHIEMFAPLTPMPLYHWHN